MTKLFYLLALLASAASGAYAQVADTVVHAEGKIIHALTKELITARITYKSLPYGNVIGTLNTSNYTFPLYFNDKYSIEVVAPGFLPAKYMIDPAEANNNKRVIRDIELTAGNIHEVKHEVGKVLRLNNLIFEVGKSRIEAESYHELDLVVRMMNDNPKMIIQLEGHTDFLGSADENMKLSEARVEAVKKYLVDKRIEKNRIKTKAFGGTAPLSRDNTPEAHRLNRRVELRILAN